MIAPEQFRDLMAGIPSPVTVLTTWDDGPAGATIGAFISLSMDPPLVLASLISGTTMLERLLRTRRFGVNLLAEHQSRHARRFASRTGDRFADIEWQLQNGLPRLGGTAAWIECELQSEVAGGDHTMVIGRIMSAETSSAQPMVYCRRSFGGHIATPTPVWDAA
ncbi:flavin reductase family protein [Microbacterium deminutum]|uniref:Flavin reductase family protein n=1 Tax=Microbacterium deminutum TaxID=344164 RepID=A0ABN2QJ12_9MICO